ncbi:putative D-xylose 1-dehydrogenase [Penicillium rolfsii]|nr:putative D-xylose 1-dehydrogenase [Penicillium rolfsii]
MTDNHLPTLRWGIIATGMIATWFTTDLVLPRANARARHIIRAVGSSSVDKAQTFVKKLQEQGQLHESNVACYGSYKDVYNDPDVDIVYIATPHSLHRQNCLDAIEHGKHVLCEKPLTVNACEARDIINAAGARGVFVMEGMWTRFRPLTRKMVEILHGQKLIGNINRAFVDFGLDMPIQDLPPTSRLRDVALGAGSLLDLGIYSLTWGILALEGEPQNRTAAQPKIAACQTVIDGIDQASSILLSYPNTGRQGILSSTILHKTDSVFARVEGTLGTLTIHGFAPMPDELHIHLKPVDAVKDMGDRPPATADEGKSLVFTFPCSTEGGRGFYYEADSIAIDISRGHTESSVHPLSETLRVLEMMDEVRRQGGVKYPQDAD